MAVNKNRFESQSAIVEQNGNIIDSLSGNGTTRAEYGKCYKKDETIYIMASKYDLTNVTANNTIVAELPEGYRPSSTKYIVGMVFRSGDTVFTPCQFKVNTDGKIYVMLGNVNITAFTIAGAII